jgi:hypothetical protein
MSCILDSGIGIECDDSVGGLEAGQILIAQRDTIENDWAATAGEITTLNQVSGTYFYRFQTNNDSADFVSTENHDPAAGTAFDETIITFNLAKMSASKNVTYKLLTRKSCVIITKDLNGVFHIFGLERGADKIGSSSMSGRAMGDMNGYTVVFNAKSKNPYTVSTSVMAALQIDEAAS